LKALANYDKFDSSGKKRKNAPITMNFSTTALLYYINITEIKQYQTIMREQKNYFIW